MIENPPLLTIHRGWRRPDHALVARFRGAQTANLVDAMEGRGAVDWRIKPLDPASAAFMLACDGFTGTAVIGDQAAGMMRNKGVTAFVTDGLARDRAGIVATGLPVFCAGITPNSLATNGPGTVGGPIMLGGLHVCSGDVVVGDADGVVVVPADRLVGLLMALDRVRAAEAESERQVKAGLTLPENVRAMVAAARIVQR